MAQGGRETEIRTSRHPTKLRHGPPINVHLLISPGISHRSMPIGIPILDLVEPRTQPAINESVTWPDASQTLNNRAINKIRIVVSRSPFGFFLIFFFLPLFFFFSLFRVRIPRNKSRWKVLDSRLGYSVLPDCHSNSDCIVSNCSIDETSLHKNIPSSDRNRTGYEYICWINVTARVHVQRKFKSTKMRRTHVICKVTWNMQNETSFYLPSISLLMFVRVTNVMNYVSRVMNFSPTNCYRELVSKMVLKWISKT